MNQLVPLVLSSLFALSAFAQPTEAMRQGDPKSEAAAQAKVDARASSRSKAATQPEANRSTNERAVAKAESRKAQRAKIGKKNSTDAQMARDSAKL